MDSSKAIIIIVFISLLSFLFTSLLVSSHKGDLTGNAFEQNLMQDAQESQDAKVKPLEYFNSKKYPLTQFKRTKDYKKSKQKYLGELLKTAPEVSFAKVPYQYYIILPSQLYSQIQETLQEYKQGVLEDTGYHTKVLFCDDCTQEEIRNTLIEGYDNDLKGALLIGDIPTAWCDFGPFGEYPTPYYYMDLDGVWTDTNQDYIFDSHTGNTDPEIFVSWLKSNDLTLIKQTEKELLEEYFQKVKDYRTGDLDFGFKSLAIADEIFQSVESNYTDKFSLVQEYHELVDTSASDYGDYLSQEYQSVYITAHSNPWVQGFTEEDEESQGCEWYNPPQPYPNAVCYNGFHNEDILDIYPKSLFYFLQGCAVGRFTEKDNIANWYIFQPEGGLIAIAPTAPVYNGPRFATYLSELISGATFGNAYLTNPDDWNKYTMTLFGSPFFKLQIPPFKYDLELPQYSYDDKFNVMYLNITSNEFSSIQNKKSIHKLSLKIYINEVLLESYQLNIGPEGKFIPLKFQPDTGENIIKSCLKSKILGDQWICLEETIYGISSPMIITKDNQLIDCEKQGINPRNGNFETNGIVIEGRDNITIQNCELSNFVYSIKLTDSTNININNNMFSCFGERGCNFHSEINIMETHNVIIFENDLINFGKGIQLGYSEFIDIRDNKFINSSNNCIESSNLKDSIILNNNFRNFKIGVYSFLDENNQLINNSFLGISTHYNVILYEGENNIFKDNYVCATSPIHIACYGNPIISEFSTGNNLNTATQCSSGWPIEGEHYDYCPTFAQPIFKDLLN